MQSLRAFARTEEPIILVGEPGTGKTFHAQLIHEHSTRRRGPFVQVNLAAVDDGLIGTELFGHVRGAFTDAKNDRRGLFTEAAGGTLFLDEIGKASIALQRKLLDVIEQQRYRPVGSDRDVRATARLVFAANEDFDLLVRDGKMLRDFVPRLGPFRVEIPPLRTRKDQLADLVPALIARNAPRFGFAAEALPVASDGLLRALAAHDWPDNVRELDGVVRLMLATAQDPRVLDESLLVDRLATYGVRCDPSKRTGNLSHGEVQRAIAECGGNKSAAALQLRIGRTTLYRALWREQADPSLS